MNKKLVRLLLILVAMAMFLVACNGESGYIPEPDPEPDPDPVVLVNLINFHGAGIAGGGTAENPFTVSLANDGTRALDVVIAPMNAANRAVNWTYGVRSGGNINNATSNPYFEIAGTSVTTPGAIVTISGRGSATAGDGYIIGRSADGNMTIFLRVSVSAPVLVDEITLTLGGESLSGDGTAASPYLATVYERQRLDFNVVAAPDNATDLRLEVAIVGADNAGTISFVEATGLLTITANAAADAGDLINVRVRAMDSGAHAVYLRVTVAELLNVDSVTPAVNEFVTAGNINNNSASNGFWHRDDVPAAFAGSLTVGVDYYISTVTGTMWDMFRPAGAVNLQRDNIIGNDNVLMYRNFINFQITALPLTASLHTLGAMYFSSFNGVGFAGLSGALSYEDSNVVFRFGMPDADGATSAYFTARHRGTVYVWIHSVTNPEVGFVVKVDVQGHGTGITDSALNNWHGQRTAWWEDRGEPEPQLFHNWADFHGVHMPGRVNEWRVSFMQGVQNAVSPAGSGQQITHFSGGNVLNIERQLTSAVVPGRPFMSMWSVGRVPNGIEGFEMELGTNGRGGHREDLWDPNQYPYGNTAKGLRGQLRFVCVDTGQSQVMVPWRKLYHDGGQFDTPPSAVMFLFSVPAAQFPEWARVLDAEVLVIIEISADTSTTTNNVEVQLRRAGFDPIIEPPRV